MTNILTNPTNFPRRINMYVKAMAYSADVAFNGETRVNFGAPAAAVATSILNVGTMTGITQTDLSNVVAIPDTYGRNIQAIASAANSTAIVVYGWDYLGQPIAESITLNGATPVVGVKAFKSFNYVTFTSAATTLSIGTGAKLGLPYKAIRAIYEIGNGVLAAAGTLNAASIIDPQTNGTPDPRGTYITTTAMNGANIISAVFNMMNDVNTSNNGGLHGLQQAAA